MGQEKREQATFYGSSNRRTNKETRGEAHALASYYGDAEAAAAVHQFIAACIPDSGYGISVYKCRYKTIYGHDSGTRWGAERAENLDKSLHAVARIGIDNKKSIEEVHHKCFPDYRDKDRDARLRGVDTFRKAMIKIYQYATISCDPAQPSDTKPIITPFELPKGSTILKDEQKHFEVAVQRARADSAEARKDRLRSAPKKAESFFTITTNFRRNPDVVAEVLERAKGICEHEKCRRPAPFLRVSDISPYFEVHHKIPLAQGGDDTVENSIALCSNCHREAHFG